MKRYLTVFLIGIIMLGLTGCGIRGTQGSSGQARMHNGSQQDIQIKSLLKTARPDQDNASERDRQADDVRGIYMNMAVLGDETKLAELIELVQSTELNAVVIDVKDDFGKLTYPSEVPLAAQLGADKGAPVNDMKPLLKRLNASGIYTIARFVTFKDPFLAKRDPAYALKRPNGKIWKDASGTEWLDPFKEEGWAYLADLSEEVAALGFNEIQYDYVRFPENAKKVDQEVAYDRQEKREKTDAILDYLQVVNQRLEPYPVHISADVFGLVTSAKDDMGIGQLWEKVAPYVDFISPMTYPSHYGEGMYGIDNPDAHPYTIMKEAAKDALERNKALKGSGGTPAQIRPWIQDFDLKSNYGPQEVRDQIKALNELGVNQYLAWNAGSVYNQEAYK